MTAIYSSKDNPNKKLSRRIANIRRRVSIIEIISAYLDLTVLGKRTHAKCPFHFTDSKTKTFVIDTNTQNFYCLSCETFGDVIGFIQGIKDISFEDAMAFLERYIASDKHMQKKMLFNKKKGRENSIKCKKKACR